MPAPEAVAPPGIGEAPRPRVLTLEERGHVYRVDGIPVPSVTQILEAAGLGIDYSTVPQAVLIHARERGRHIDACCDLLDEDDLDWRSVHPEALPYVEAWRRFRVADGYQPAVAKPRIYHPEYGYAGEPDTIGRVGACWTVLDRKATDKVSLTYGCQLGGYAVPGAWVAEEGGVLAPAPWPALARAVVQLRRDGTYRVVPYEAPDDTAAFLGAVALWQWRRARELVAPRSRRGGVAG